MKITQLRVKEKTTALTTMNIETWIEEIRTVKIWVKFTRPDNSLPQKREEAEIFHAHAYRFAVKCYQP